jgi:DNA replication licensing factor MCM5
MSDWLMEGRDRLRSSLLLHHHTLDIDLRDLVIWNEELAQKVQENPGDMIPLVFSVHSSRRHG